MKAVAVIVASILTLGSSIVVAADMKDLPNPGTQMKQQMQGQLLDINTASQEQLKQVPGIGDQYAKKIMAGRPFSSVEELNSKGIIPPALYDNVKGFLTVGAPK